MIRSPTASSGLSKDLLLPLGSVPPRWRELFDQGDFGRWQAGKQILQVVKWVDAMPPTTAQLGVNHRTAFSG
jgi:hypothetical protein